jgi:hypothetical protein
MSRKLLMTAAVIAIALAPPIGVGTAEAHGGARAGGGIQGGGFHGGGFRAGHFHDHDFPGLRQFRGDGLRFGGVFGGYYPGYYGYGTCYLTIYGTTACY